jgi:hypothetical protein
MKRFLLVVVAVASVILTRSQDARAEFHAVRVVAFDAGEGGSAGFDQPAAALGEPARFTGVGAFPGVVSAFNPPFMPSEVVSIGEGGSLTLRLSHYLLPGRDGHDLGVFTNVGFIDNDFPNGVASDPLSASAGTFGADAAVLEVSPNGVDWTTVGETLFDLPTVGYRDVTNPFAGEPGSEPTDFNKPFTGSLDNFAGLAYADMLDLLDGSGGGKWLDLAGTDLAFIGWIRFSVPDDGNAATSLKFDLDAVSVNTLAAGPAVPEPSSMVIASIVAIGALVFCVGQRRPA